MRKSELLNKGIQTYYALGIQECFLKISQVSAQKCIKNKSPVTVSCSGLPQHKCETSTIPQFLSKFFSALA